MDRHNMMLFLQNDTSKLHPAGFEITRRNIFDPEDDPVQDFEHNGFAKLAPGTSWGAAEKDGENNNCQVCARKGCNRRPRFESVFCSDSCGVSTLELDLLRSLQYATKLHPSVLRI